MRHTQDAARSIRRIDQRRRGVKLREPEILRRIDCRSPQRGREIDQVILRQALPVEGPG
jgi:hypothetical protein